MTFDANENLYILGYPTGTQTTLSLFTPLQNKMATFLTLPYNAFGVAVDIAHNHLFIIDETSNVIRVYTTAGKFIQTLN